MHINAQSVNMSSTVSARLPTQLQNTRFVVHR